MVIDIKANKGRVELHYENFGVGYYDPESADQLADFMDDSFAEDLREAAEIARYDF